MGKDWLLPPTHEQGSYNKNQKQIYNTLSPSPVTFQLNTFQCILATDGRYGFVIFLYPRGGIQWTTGDSSEGMNGLGGSPAVAGFSAGDSVRYYALKGSGTHDIINIDEYSNTMIPGMYVYQVDRDAIFPGGCWNEIGMLYCIKLMFNVIIF